MRIQANLLDDLRKQRDEYDAELHALNEQEDANTRRWREADRAKSAELESTISNLIGPTSLDLSIQVDSDYWGGVPTYRISIAAARHNQFSDAVALSWNWDVKVDKDGNVVKDSGSWSGLKAVTADQIANLEESVRVIKILNDIDWEPIVKAEAPRYEDYADQDLHDRLRAKKADRPDFESQIKDAQLRDLVGTDTAVQLIGDQYYRGSAGILLTNVTDKFVTGYIFPWFKVSGGSADAEKLRQYAYEPRRTSKDKVVFRDGELITVEL